ncbi:hypothetical protein [Aquimarina algiphila]|uniref:hypothetical protein n=1 Tax=Aquimarina algiphila TaxID=2047982 RepID=UPI00232F9D85|nr:hypothetical protein [Aquimarina algiphila]
MKTLYNNIIAKLMSNEAKTAYAQSSVAACKFVDLYRGQYLNWEAFDTFPLPAVLFEFGVNYDSKGEGTATITLHLCYEQLQDTSSITRTRDNALKFFDFVTVTNTLLSELESQHTGKLQLVSEETIKDDAIVNVYLLTFSSRYNGRNTEKYKYVNGEELKVNGKIRYDLDF